MVRSPNSESFRQTSRKFSEFSNFYTETKKLLPSSSSLFAIKPTLKGVNPLLDNYKLSRRGFFVAPAELDLSKLTENLFRYGGVSSIAIQIANFGIQIGLLQPSTWHLTGKLLRTPTLR